MVILHLNVINLVSTYFRLLNHIIIELGTTSHKSIRINVETNTLACNSCKSAREWSSSLNVRHGQHVMAYHSL